MADQWHVEAWSLPLATSTRTVARVPFVKGAAGAAVKGGHGRGSVTVRKDWDRLDDVTDPDNSIGSLFRVFRDNVLVPELSFFGRRDARNLEDEAAGMVTISGPGIGDVMNYGRVENFDYPVSPTIDPDWSWGAGAALNGFKNPSFEESVHAAPTLTGGKYDIGTGFEDENTAGWKSIPSSRFEDGEPNDVDPTVDNVDARTGSFSLHWTAGDAVSGIEKAVRIAGQGPAPAAGHRYQFTIYLKAFAGSRFIFGVENVAIVHHANGFISNGIGWAELDNVAEGTGSTDATWQQIDLDITFDSFTNYANVNLYILYDDTGSGPNARIDDYSGAGFNLGLFPWEPTSFAFVTTFARDTSPPTAALDGTAVAQIITGAAGHGIGQPVEGLTPGRTYTFIGNIHHDIGVNQTFTVRIVRTDGGTVIATTSLSIATGGTWTEVVVTGEVDVEDVFVQILLEGVAATWWVDATRSFDGQAAAAWGDIQQQLMDDAAVDHTGEAGNFARDTLGFVDYTSFTALLDSAGNAWTPTTVEYRAKRGKKYKQIGTDGEQMGYEWRVRDTATGIELDVFNPHDWTTRTGGMGTDLSGTGVPEIVYGAGVTSGPIVRQPSTANRVHIEGEGGLFEVRRDAASIAAYDTRELYEGSTDFLDGVTLGQIADQTLDERIVPTTALKVNLAPHMGDNVPIPFRDFTLGDTYPVNLIGDFTGPKRVMQITVNFTPGFGIYTVEFDRLTFTSDPLKATVEAVRLLMEQATTLDAPADVSTPATVAPVEAAAEPAFLVAAADAADVTKAAAHYICNGTNDQVEINAALAALPFGTPVGGKGDSIRGTVQLSEGGFHCNGDINIPGGAGLIGRGLGTLVDGNGTAGLRFVMNSETELGNMGITESVARSSAAALIFASTTGSVAVHDLYVFQMLSLTSHFIDFSGGSGGGRIWDNFVEVGVGGFSNIGMTLNGPWTVSGNHLPDFDTGIQVNNGDCYIYDNIFDSVTLAIKMTSDFADVMIGPNVYKSVTTPFEDADTDVVTTRFTDVRTAVWALPGVGVVAAGVQRLYFLERAFILSAAITADTAGTGSGFNTLDVHKNGVTVFTTQANRPTLAAAENNSGPQGPDVRDIALDDYLTVDLDAITGTTAAEDLVAIVRYVEVPAT